MRLDSRAIFDLVVRVQDDLRALFKSSEYLGFKLAPVADFNITTVRYALLNREYAPAIA